MKRSIDWPHAPPHRLGSSHPYFVTAATYRKQHFLQSEERLDVLQRGLLSLCKDYQWDLHDWAIFSNHYHFIASPPNQEEAVSLQRIITTLHSKTARWINRQDNTAGRRVWHNYRDTILSFENSYYARLRYVHTNAVHHQLVHTPEDYPWCSAAWFKRTAKSAFVKTIEGFKTDQLTIPDDFQPVAATK